MKKATKDIYDREVDRVAKLTGDNARRAWMFGVGHSPLFDGCGRIRDENGWCGCLTQVRAGSSAEIFEGEIRSDELIPKDEQAFFLKRWTRLALAARKKILRRFAYWQRRLDNEISDRQAPRKS